jgi:hypothetical protein
MPLEEAGDVPADADDDVAKTTPVEAPLRP